MTQLALVVLASSTESKKSGPIALAVILILCVACYFLFKSMSRHLRKVREEFPGATPPAAPSPAASSDGDGEPAGEADGEPDDEAEAEPAAEPAMPEQAQTLTHPADRPSSAADTAG